MTYNQLVFMGIVAALAFAMAFICLYLLAEAKDEIGRLKTIVRHIKKISDLRYMEFKTSYLAEYEEIARIYEEDENNELHA